MLSDFWKDHADYGFHPHDQALIPNHKVIDWDLKEALRHDAIFDEERALHAKVHRQLLPQPFAGNLERASVFLLYGNPGFKISDYRNDYENSRYINLCRANLRGEIDGFVWLHPDIADTGPGIYWRARFKTLANELSRETGEDFEISMQSIAKSVALLEAGVYHSKKNPGDWFFELPSSRVARTFAGSVLKPKADVAECLIIVWRRADFWMLDRGPNILVRPSSQAQGSYLQRAERSAILQRIMFTYTDDKANFGVL
jgi:hypothetical protein